MDTEGRSPLDLPLKGEDCADRLFSTVVDDFTAFGMTAAEAETLLVEEYDVGRQTAGRMVAAGVEDHRPGLHGVRGTGDERWRDSLSTVGSVHGPEGLAATLAEMGFAGTDTSVVRYREADQ